MKDVISHNGVFIVSERRELSGVLQRYTQGNRKRGGTGKILDTLLQFNSVL